jgi:hypothetical protein
VSPWKRIRRPVPCQHIADYYDRLWASHHCIAWNLLRRGYGQWAAGRIERGANNLFGESQ